ncbi:MAG: hypothetical protein ABI557_12550 [Aureliella sp.]
MSKREVDFESFEQLEARLFAARDYVIPSSDLRPRTLEQARHTTRGQDWANRLTLITLASMLLWSVTMPLLRELSLQRDKLSGPFPAEIERAAQDYADQHRYEAQWGLVEAFRDARQLRLIGER